MSQLLMREETIGKTPKVELRVTETQLTYNDHRGGRGGVLDGHYVRYIAVDSF